MQSKTTQQIEDRFKQIQSNMAKSIGVKPEQLTKVEQSIIFAHFVNTQFGLQSLNRKGVPVDFPQGWNQSTEGVYKINYRLASHQRQKQQNALKTIQFRFVDNQQHDGSISINYALEDTQELHQYQFKYQKQKVEDNYKAYFRNLQEKLKGKKQQISANSNTRNLQPVWREVNNYNQPNNQPNFPMPLIRPGQNQGHFNPPFTGGEYIGPDNQIFRGRGTNNPFQPFNPNPNPLNDPRRPIGSRYDPIDPFGTQGVDQPHRRDFMGFNQFGKPLGGNKGGFGGSGPGRFL